MCPCTVATSLTQGRAACALVSCSGPCLSLLRARVAPEGAESGSHTFAWPPSQTYGGMLSLGIPGLPVVRTERRAEKGCIF